MLLHNSSTFTGARKTSEILFRLQLLPLHQPLCKAPHRTSPKCQYTSLYRTTFIHLFFKPHFSFHGTKEVSLNLQNHWKLTSLTKPFFMIHGQLPLDLFAVTNGYKQGQCLAKTWHLTSVVVEPRLFTLNILNVHACGKCQMFSGAKQTATVHAVLRQFLHSVCLFTIK